MRMMFVSELDSSTLYADIKSAKIIVQSRMQIKNQNETKNKEKKREEKNDLEM